MAEAKDGNNYDHHYLVRCLTLIALGAQILRRHVFYYLKDMLIYVEYCRTKTYLIPFFREEPNIQTRSILH